MAEVWRSLSDEERDATRRYYDPKGIKPDLSEAQLGSEYTRIIIQQRLTGQTTEEFQGGLTAVVKAHLRKVLRFILEVIGNQPPTALARQVVERLEAAIRGEGPVERSAGGVTSQQDAEYLAAVARGDMAAAQRMVDEAAYDSGFTQKVFHGTHEKFNEFSISKRQARRDAYRQDEWGIWTTADKPAARNYGPEVLSLYGKMKSPRRFQTFEEWFRDFVRVAYPLFDSETVTQAQLKNDLQEYIGARQGTSEYQQALSEFPGPEAYRKDLQQSGNDGVIIEGDFIDGSLQTVLVFLDSNQLKKSDPVTYDSSGQVIPLSQRFNPASNDIRYSNLREDSGSPFYSQLTDSIARLPQETMTVQQARALIEKGAKKDEIAQQGLFTDPLSPLYGKQPGDKVTKKELLDYSTERAAKVETVTLGSKGIKEAGWTDAQFEAAIARAERRRDFDEAERLTAIQEDLRLGSDANNTGNDTHFSQYQLPGADEGSYREMFVTWPKETEQQERARIGVPYSAKIGEGGWEVRTREGKRFGVYSARSEQEAIQKAQFNGPTDWARRGEQQQPTWNDGHSQYSDITNPIVRIRRNIRTMPDGTRTYFIEEIQGPSKSEQEKMPDYLRKRIYEIGMKRALRDAVDDGADVLAWTTGEQQAERYDLSKQVQKLSAKKNADGSFEIRILPTDGSMPRDIDVESESKLVDTVGKELAAKIAQQEVGLRPEYSGDNLKVGGEGLKALYDRTLPSIAGDIAKKAKADARVGTVEIATPENRKRADDMSDAELLQELHRFSDSLPVHAMPIPTALKAQVERGQTLFSLGKRPGSDPRPGLSVKQATEALFPFAFGGLPPNTEVTHRLDNLFNDREVRGSYDPNTGKIWLNAAYLRTPEEVRAVFVEEALHAVENDPKIQAEMDRLYATVSEEQRQAVRETYATEDEVTVRAEAIADILEQESLSSEQRSIIQKLWLAIKDALTRLFGKLNADWNSVETDARVVIAKALRAAAEGRRTYLATPETGKLPIRRSLGPSVDPSRLNLSQSAVDVAASKVAEFGKQRIAEFNAAAAKLDELAYEKSGYKKARTDLANLVDLATGRIQQMPTPDWRMLPDPSRGVVIFQEKDSAGEPTGEPRIVVDGSFSDKLTALGVAHDRANVESMQAETFFERKAIQLTNSLRELKGLKELRDYYDALPKADRENIKDDIEELLRELISLQEQTDFLASVRHTRGSDVTTVGTRADAIEKAQDAEIETRAMADARHLPQVIETFGEPGKQREALLGTLKDLLADKSLTTPEAETLRALISTDDTAQQFGTLTDNQKQVVVTNLAKLLQRFDSNRESIRAVTESVRGKLSKSIQELKRKQADAQVDEGNAQILLSDILKADKGDPNVTGTLQTQAEIQALEERLGTVLEFAKRIGKNRETNKALYDYLTNVSLSSAQAIDPDLLTSAGIDPLTVKMVLDIARKSPAFGSAITALIRHAANEKAFLPAVSLREIGRIVAEDIAAGKPAAQIGEAVKPLVQRMQNDANAAVSAARAMQRTTAKELADLTVELRSHELGTELFDSVASSPDFGTLRSFVETQEGAYVKPILLLNSKRITLEGFGKQGSTPTAPEYSYAPSGDNDPITNKEWRDKLLAYFKSAQEYVAEYQLVRSQFSADPNNNPSPESLGYDALTVRGLQQALASDMPRLLDWANSDFAATLRSTFPERLTQNNALLGKFMRTAEQSIGLLRGVLGNVAVQHVSDWVFGDIKGNRIQHRFKDIDAKISAAMRSHAKDGINLNVERYQNEVFNPLAHYQRQFVAQVTPGYELRPSGIRITSEDIALLKRVQEYGEAKRREITEHRTDRGVVETVGGKKLVRRGASPGVVPIERHLDYAAEGWSNSLVEAWNNTAEAERTFSPQTDLSANSTNPLVKFWNRHIKDVTAHILDVDRKDRSIKLDPGLEPAEHALSRDIRQGAVTAPTSLEEMVQLLASRLPNQSGQITRDYVIRALGSELKQFHSEAVEVANIIKDSATAAGIEVALTSMNEFTKPAALLRLPSTLYTYGALTPAQRLMSVRRANHENAVRAISGIMLAANDIRAAIQFYQDESTGTPDDAKEKKAFAEYGGSLEVAQQTVRAVDSFAKDFIEQFRIKEPLLPPGLVKNSWSTITGGLLASPFVLVNNVILAGQAIYMAHQAANQLGRIGAAIAVGKHVVRAAVSGTAMLVEWLSRSGSRMLDPLTRRWLGTPAGKRVVADAVRSFTKNILKLDPWADAAEVQRIGFSQRDRFFDQMKQGFRKMAEFENIEDEVSANRTPFNRIRGKVDRFNQAMMNVAQQLIAKGGVEAQDLLINTANMALVRAEENFLKGVAIGYGKARENLGAFNFNDKGWILRPDEVFIEAGATERARLLGQLRDKFRKSAGSSGVQLEQALYDYYQASKTNPDAPFFTQEQADNYARQTLADMNASTKANRPSYSITNPLAQELFKFMGYPANLLGGMIKQMSVAKGTPLFNALASNLGNIAAIITVGTVLALTVGTAKEWWRRFARGEFGRSITPMDPEFWGSPQTAAKAIGMAAASSIPFLGGAVLNAYEFTTGGKGYDPASTFLLPSVLNRMGSMFRGFVHLPGWSKVKALHDVADQMVPLYREATHVFGMERAGKNSVNIAATALDAAGIERPKSSSASYAPSYGAKTGFMRDLEQAVYKMARAQISGDSAGYQAALADATKQRDALLNYYQTDKQMTPSQALDAAWRDYQSLNPIKRANGGKSLTEEEFSRFNKALGDSDRATEFRSAYSGYEAGGNVLFGKQPNTVKQGGGSSAGREESAGGGTFGNLGLANVGTSRQGAPREQSIQPARRISLGGGSSSGARASSRIRGVGNRLRGVSVRAPRGVRAPRQPAIRSSRQVPVLAAGRNRFRASRNRIRV